ncbi:MAG: ABC transporter permease subunit [Chloroflexi bacterium]|nr:ABC transporter permease subunit [Chloroflexota bacterium]
MPTFIIARLTFIEAIRRRILLAAFLLGVAFLILYGVGFYIIRTEAVAERPNTDAINATLMRGGIDNFLALAGLYAVNFLAIAMGALVSADTLAGEINSGTIQALVTKPVHRAEIVLGKWLGFAGLLAMYLVLMAGGVMAVAYVLDGYIVPNPWTGILLIYLETLLIMTITLMCSSMLSTLATGGVIFGMYGIAFIGGWVEQFGALLQNQGAVNIGIVSSLLIPSEALWRRAAYEMTPSIAQVVGISFSGPMFNASVPSQTMIVYAMGYLVVAFTIAVRIFSKRDL